MRIALDASNLRGGGGVSHLVQIIEAADPERHGFESITVFGCDATLRQLPAKPDWLILIRHPWLEKPLPFRTAWRNFILPRILQDGYDIVFAPGGLIGPSRLPRVTMCRNMLPFDAEEAGRYPLGLDRLRLALLRGLQKRAFRKADGLIFLTDYARTSVLGQMRRPPKRETIIPHGIATRFGMEARPQRSIADCTADDPFRLLYVSSVNRYKHQWNVVEAVAHLQAKGLPIALDLVGGGEASAIARLKSTIEYHQGSTNNITYHGKISFQDIHARYHDADGFIFASTCENMPNILLEAMSASLPILCADKSPMPEILGDAGAYGDPTSVSDFEHALSAFLDDHEARRKWAGAAAKRAGEFSWQTCADETFAFLKSVWRP